MPAGGSSGIKVEADAADDRLQREERLQRAQRDSKHVLKNEQVGYTIGAAAEEDDAAVAAGGETNLAKIVKATGGLGDIMGGGDSDDGDGDGYGEVPGDLTAELAADFAAEAAARADADHDADAEAE